MQLFQHVHIYYFLEQQRSVNTNLKFIKLFTRNKNSRSSSRYGPPLRTEYRLIVENLSSRVSWQVSHQIFLVPNLPT